MKNDCSLILSLISWVIPPKGKKLKLHCESRRKPSRPLLKIQVIRSCSFLLISNCCDLIKWQRKDCYKERGNEYLLVLTSENFYILMPRRYFFRCSAILYRENFATGKYRQRTTMEIHSGSGPKPPRFMTG